MFDAVERVCAAVRRLQTADQADQRCFPGAIPADKTIDGALWNVHGQTIQRGEMPVSFDQRIRFKHIFHMDQFLLLLDTHSISGKG